MRAAEGRGVRRRKDQRLETSPPECSTTITQIKEILQADGQRLAAAGYLSRDELKRGLSRLIRRCYLVMHSRRVVGSRSDARLPFPFVQSVADHARRIRAALDTAPGPDSVRRAR